MSYVTELGQKKLMTHVLQQFRGLSRTEMAKKLGKHPSVLKGYINNRHTMCTDAFLSICEAMQCEPWKFESNFNVFRGGHHG